MTISSVFGHSYASLVHLVSSVILFLLSVFFTVLSRLSLHPSTLVLWVQKRDKTQKTKLKMNLPYIFLNQKFYRYCNNNCFVNLLCHNDHVVSMRHCDSLDFMSFRNVRSDCLFLLILISTYFLIILRFVLY